jgi:uncharacterized SAM-binding protein YcdF (DUF218 family)
VQHAPTQTAVPPVTEPHLEAARVIYDFHQLRHKPIPADVILALGTNDLRVAEHAAALYHGGFGRTLICTGGIAHQGDLLATPWDRPEAEMFAEVARAHGVPPDRILLEPRATNTAENVRFARVILEALAEPPRNLVIAVKPFMQRRTWATLAVEWPEMPATVSSPSLTLDEYFTPDLPPEKIIPILMGDLQRIWIYGKRGWSAPQRIPTEVREAFEFLKDEGFTQHLIAE